MGKMTIIVVLYDIDNNETITVTMMTIITTKQKKFSNANNTQAIIFSIIISLKVIIDHVYLCVCMTHLLLLFIFNTFLLLLPTFCYFV